MSLNRFAILVIFLLFLQCDAESGMLKSERIYLREQARDMFYHAYNAYMENAYPADELMPLSCRGRYRGQTPNRGDIDDCLGNFSLTLIDSLDTLAILGDFSEFERAVKLVIDDVSFDNDVIVSVFETNIRVLGGLLSAHIIASILQDRDHLMRWYKGELLNKAKDLGHRLLPAFNTTTGIPYSRVNLKHGVYSAKLELMRETCTACAGSMILEMAALSRLTGEPVFEEKAHKAMDELWKMRNRGSDLMGSVLNVHSGDWVRRDSGVGAGIDSYYEYCLKAYILLGDNRYLDRFNRHYSAVRKYISQGPMLIDVLMHRPYTNARNFMDALHAFWPGLQVLKGDIGPAIETHEMLYQVMQRHKFIPEAFTLDFQVHWGNHPLRPEFLESTYYLHEATGDPYYLEVGKRVLESLQRYARVPCGYAAVNDVRTAKQEDRMDSFVLSETLKYLYLLFADKDDVPLNLDEFIFSTEGHPLPLTLGANRTRQAEPVDDADQFARSCPNTMQLCPDSFRRPLRNMVDGRCPPRQGRAAERRLRANEFSASNAEHVRIIKDMGIEFVLMKDGKVQLVHSFAAAKSPIEAQKGLLFMQEMVELSKFQSEPTLQSISFNRDDTTTVSIQAGHSQFGKNLRGLEVVRAGTKFAVPYRACEDIKNPSEVRGKIAIIERGDCMFVDKARKAQLAGAAAAVIVDNAPGTSLANSPLFSMSGDGTDDVAIPTVFLYSNEAAELLLEISQRPDLELTIGEHTDEPEISDSLFDKFKMSVQEFINKHTGSKSITVGDLIADVTTDKIRITRKKSDKSEVFWEASTDFQWSKIRRTLLQSIESEPEIYVPLNILGIYYQTLSGRPKDDDKLVQATWLLRQLMIESQRDNDNLIVVKTESAEALEDMQVLVSYLKDEKSEEQRENASERVLDEL